MERRAQPGGRWSRRAGRHGSRPHGGDGRDRGRHGRFLGVESVRSRRGAVDGCFVRDELRCTASIAQAAPATCRPRPLTARSVRCLPLRRQLRGTWNGGRPWAHRTDASSTACWPRANMRSGWCHRPGRVGLLAAGAFCDIIESSAQPAVGCPRGPSDGHDTQQAEHVFQPAPADRPLALPRTAPVPADVSRRRRPRPPSIQRIRLT